MFYYKVEYWNSTDQEPRQESGLLSAKTYADAAKAATEAYGIESIMSLYLEEWDNVISEDEIMEGFERADVKD